MGLAIHLYPLEILANGILHTTLNLRARNFLDMVEALSPVLFLCHLKHVKLKNINVTWYVTGVMAYISNDSTQAFFVMILFLVVQPVEACKWLNIVFFST